MVDQKLKVVVLFEGRDAAGKGGVIKRVTQRLNPRICRTVALSAPTERERTQWYFQRYVSHLPGAGEIVLFDRSWYNRAGVERVMGFCSEADVEEFFRTVPEFERMLVRSGIILLKYWFSITDPEQNLRFHMRIHDPLKQWKLSPMDLQSRRRWEEYTKAKEEMLDAHAHRRGALVGGRRQRQAPCPPELHPSSAAAGTLPRGRASADRAARARAQAGLHAHAGTGVDVRAEDLLIGWGHLATDDRQRGQAAALAGVGIATLLSCRSPGGFPHSVLSKPRQRPARPPRRGVAPR